MAKLKIIVLDDPPPRPVRKPAPAVAAPARKPTPKPVIAPKKPPAVPRPTPTPATLREPKQPRKHKRFILTGVAVVFFGIIGFYGWRLLGLRDFASQSKTQIIAQLAEARAALSNINPNEAQKPLTEINDELLALQNEASKYGVLQIASFWDKIRDTVNGLPGILQDLTGISGTAIHLNEDISFLKEHTLGLMLKQRGPELLDRLAQLQDKMARLSVYVTHIQTSETTLDAATQESFKKFSEELTASSQAIAALRTFLNPKTERHVLVMFQNETELRPGGGFLGSYADVTIKQGGVANIEVRDIYDPDGQLNIKMIPPAPLQRLTKDWEARDANWFFNFPSSARKVISFLNQSQIYVDRGVTFEGALAINTRVLGDLINIVGPIDIPEYNLTITGETFLRELQREVEIGDDKKVNQPKRILQILAPIMLGRFSDRTPEQDTAMLEKIKYHFSRRNLMLYLDNPVLEQQLTKLDVGGEISSAIKTGPDSITDYLAVVSANMAGGKSDAVTKQQIKLVSTFNATGTLVSNLTIERTHTGKNEDQWWYRAPNKTYTQIYMPLGSKIYTAKGAQPWPDPIVRNYAGYTADVEVAATENTRRLLPDEQLERFIEFEKTVFAGWLTTPAGEKSTFTIDYRNPKKFSGQSGSTYDFIFEKQSGANTNFNMKVNAPDGFIWKETGTTELTYSDEDPPGRVKISGTLVTAAQ